ncbi:MAG: right-handed parallel beta-helix repeat-containing protein [Prevotella sp.]|nr:right-handed parallel beta-helix repeat-containing protein [Prevotella sp.]
MKLLQLIALLLTALTAQHAAAQGMVRFAAPGGHDAEGLSAQRPGSIDAMIRLLQPADTLLLADGQYDLTQKIFIPQSGRPDSLITIKAMQGARPVLDFRQQPIGNGNNGIQMKGSYLHLKGLTVRYAGYKGVWLEYSRHCVLEQIEVYGCCNAGIQLRKGGYNVVLNCDAHDNFDYQDEGGNADGFADKQGGAPFPGNTYIGCRAWHNSDDGWDSFQRITGDSVPTRYINCITYNNGPAYFDLSQHPRVLGVDSALACFKGKDLSHFPNGGNPNGFKVGGKGTKHDAELINCLAVGHRSKGFDQNHDAGTVSIVDCTACQNTINYGFGNQEPCLLQIIDSKSLAPGESHLLTPPNGSTSLVSNKWVDGDIDMTSTDWQRLLLAPRKPDGSLPDIPRLFK